MSKRRTHRHASADFTQRLPAAAKHAAGNSVTCALGMLSATNGQASQRGDDYAESVMRVIEYLIGPKR
jgi:hypothetical protein